jgi:RNA polymerase sigma-70 factor (ECF subfamily)
MTPTPGDTTRLLDRLRAGDARARDSLLEHTCDRLRRLTRRMLKTYPGVRRWEGTDDVLQNALLRLHRALADVAPESARHFHQLAALAIRRELLDLARHYAGPLGLAKKHHTDSAGRSANDPGGALHSRAAVTEEPASLEEWELFHERAAALPDEERELFGLLFYEGLTQDEAAAVLGVSPRTVKRRWQAARLRLARALGGHRPG